jgi:hypothetical protein
MNRQNSRAPGDDPLTGSVLVRASLVSHVRRALRRQLGWEAERIATAMLRKPLTQRQFDGALGTFNIVLALLESVGAADPDGVRETDVELDLDGARVLFYKALHFEYQSKVDQIPGLVLASDAHMAALGVLRELGELLKLIEEDVPPAPSRRWPRR